MGLLFSYSGPLPRSQVIKVHLCPSPLPEWLIVVTHELPQAPCQGIPIQSRTLTLTTPRGRFSDYAHLTDKNTEARRGGGACRRSLTSKGQRWALKPGLSDSEPYALDSVVEDLTGWGKHGFLSRRPQQPAGVCLPPTDSSGIHNDRACLRSSLHRWRWGCALGSRKQVRKARAVGIRPDSDTGTGLGSFYHRP